MEKGNSDLSKFLPVAILSSPFWIMLLYMIFSTLSWEHKHDKQALKFKKVDPASVCLGANPPTDEEMEFVVPRCFSWGSNPYSIKNITKACYENNEMQIEYSSSVGRVGKIFTNISPSRMDVLFNVPKGSLGWLLHYTVPGFNSIDPDTYGMILHLPEDYRLKTCE